jgi:alpha-glucosidase
MAATKISAYGPTLPVTARCLRNPGLANRVTPKMDQNDENWWRNGIFYQIYPRSFQDSNADGVGDIAGIIKRLPYLVELGIDAVWLSPIFPSPMADFGYDVADYTGIDPLFGTLEDFDTLIFAAHESGLRVILDLVPNHTSDRHPWFLESRSSRDNPKRDWYIWREPKPDGSEPNNWLSEFGGSGWEYDATTGQYYYHAFLAQQPDLNWHNGAVRRAIYEVMRYWLRRGVDGFRVDVIWHLIKDAEFRDNPLNPDFRDGRPPHEKFLPRFSTDQPEVHDVIAEMRRVTDEFKGRVLIGEIYLPLQRLVAYYGKDLAGAQMPFNFSLLSAPWHARPVENIIAEYERALPPGAWPNWVLGNHDRPRIASRVGQQQARAAAMLLLTLRGTPTLYYGDEIAMQQVAIAPDQVRSLREERSGDRRRPGRLPDSHAVGRLALCRLLECEALASARRRFSTPKRRQSHSRRELHSLALPCPDRFAEKPSCAGVWRICADRSRGKFIDLPQAARCCSIRDRAEPGSGANLHRFPDHRH